MAAVITNSAYYDLGDLLMKNQNSNSATSPATPMIYHHQQKLLRFNNELLQHQQHQTVSRRVSTPISTATLVNSVATLLPVLENIQQQQQTLHRKLDRSLSEPAKMQVQNVNSSRYKTELCRPYEESGACKYGDKCQFAHGAHELRSLARHPKYKTELCRTFHTIGFCPYGPRCHFVHNAEEVRASLALQRRPAPLSISAFNGSISGSPSPTSSLSQSPTTSFSSFFSEADNVSNPSPPPPLSNPVSPRQSPTPETRLPVFNLMGLGINLEEILMGN